MLISPDEELVISNFGYADGAAVWAYDARKKTTKTIRFHNQGAKCLSIHNGDEGHFSIVHHYEGSRFVVTAHSFSDPTKIVSRISITPGSNSEHEGDLGIWKYLSKVYVEFFQLPAKADFYLFILDPVTGNLELQELTWFDDSYDKGYQGVIGVVAVPGSEDLLFSVQRSSRVVLYSPAEKKKIGTVDLSEQYGNPHLYFMNSRRELWAHDYDTVLKLDPADWRIIKSVRLQDGDKKSMKQFVGRFTFTQDESICVVPRPFSNDVILLDTELRENQRIKIGPEPLHAVLLKDGSLVARSWKTGNLLTAHA